MKILLFECHVLVETNFYSLSVSNTSNLDFYQQDELKQFVKPAIYKHIITMVAMTIGTQMTLAMGVSD